ncbi:MAG: phosphatase PAP2 family protein [Bacteroidales bacterium]|nr:phosphatase PAP2 family protein [Bacteroidales bacterium]
MKRIELFGGSEGLVGVESFLRKTANIFSIAFHPMMMPIYAMLYVLYGNQLWSLLPTSYKTVTMLYVSLGTSILPLASLAVMIMMGLVGDPEMPNKSERILPLGVATILVGAMCFILHYKVDLPLPMVRLTEGMLFMLIIAVMITPMWKISLHGMGVGALLAFVSILGMASHIDFSFATSVSFAIAGIVAWSRLYLGSHTPLQLLFGLLAGIGAMTLAMLHP